MLLSSAEIEAELTAGRLVITDYDPRLLRRASYTLRLGDQWRKWKKSGDVIQMWSPNAASGYISESETAPTVVLRSGDFVLGCSKESLSLPDNLAGIVCALSHVARFGVFVTMGSLLVRPGFAADAPTALTLELASLNPSPIEVAAGMPVCHLAFVRTKGSFNLKKKSPYEGQAAPSVPLLYEDMSRIIGNLPLTELE